MKSIVVIIFAIIGWQACTDPARKETSNSETAQTDSSGIIKSGDAEFLTSAAASGMLELELSKLTETNSSNERVRSFGSMMQKEHREAHDQIRALASAQNITLVDTLTEDQKKDLEQLKGKKGPAFDLDFMWFVVKDHRADVKKFKDAAKDVNDPDIKAFAAETLPILEKHLDSAKAIHESLKPSIDNIIVP